MQTVAQRSADGVRLSPPVVGFGADMRERSLALKQFLFHNLYRHPQVMATTDWARSVVGELFQVYLDSPQEMPPEHRQRPNRARAVADYIAGMTDRFATREHARLCPASPTALNHPLARHWP
jgi:dGTPase